MSLDKWDKRFLDLARHIATWSKDPSTQVGCVIVKGKNKVVSMGYNGPPAGVNDEFRDRAQKLLRTLHAEDNAILAAKEALDGCTAFVTHAPCSNCAARLIQSGIIRVVFPQPSTEFIQRWYDSYTESLAMFNEVGVKLEVVL
jgi:dCMP deaminase